MDLQDLADRAKRVADPEDRAEALAKVLELAGYTVTDGTIDLAMTKDGRKSFKNKGKWKHGFIPADTEAKVAKAKGSPIAMRRMNRLFGGASKTKNLGEDGVDKPNTRKAPKSVPKGRFQVRNKTGGTVTSNSAASLGSNVKVAEKAGGRVKNNQFEKNRVGRSTATATQKWDDIEADKKVVRDGKRYVLAEYNGQQILTEWQGGVHEQKPTDQTKQVSLTPADADKMTTGQLRKLLKDPRSALAARQVARQALNRKLAQG